MLSLKKVRDPAEFGFFIWNRPHVKVAMIREVPYPYMDLPGVPPGNKWLSQVYAFLSIDPIPSDSLVLALCQRQHVHLIVPQRL